jgi:hypothetical protein
MQVNASLSLKIGNAYRYRTLIKFDNIEWCSALDNINKMAKNNRFVKPALKDIKAIAPKILEPCPFVGDFHLINIASPENVFSILPSGDYSGKVRIKDLKQQGDVSVEVRFTKLH